MKIEDMSPYQVEQLISHRDYQQVLAGQVLAARLGAVLNAIELGETPQSRAHGQFRMMLTRYEQVCERARAWVPDDGPAGWSYFSPGDL